jgi:membrane protein implicated in regulation of membrane protease activity
MKRNQGLPQWLVVLLVLAAIVVLGPPTLGLVLGLLGLTIGLAAVALKVGLVVLAVYAVVVLLRVLFGKSTPDSREQRLSDSLDDNLDRLAQVDVSRRALDEELERAVAAAQK